MIGRISLLGFALGVAISVGPLRSVAQPTLSDDVKEAEGRAQKQLEKSLITIRPIRNDKPDTPLLLDSRRFVTSYSENEVKSERSALEALRCLPGYNFIDGSKCDDHLRVENIYKYTVADEVKMLLDDCALRLEFKAKAPYSSPYVGQYVIEYTLDITVDFKMLSVSKIYPSGDTVWLWSKGESRGVGVALHESQQATDTTKVIVVPGVRRAERPFEGFMRGLVFGVASQAIAGEVSDDLKHAVRACVAE